MYTVEIKNDLGYVIDEAHLRAAATTVLSQQNAPPNSALTVVISDNESVARLNRQYRGIDAPTDVLSFPADMPPLKLHGEPPYLGDLVIAYPYAAAQAQSANHDLGDSLSLLVVHGTLHLLGYDHETPENRARMWAAQDEALRALDISLQIVPALENYDYET